MKPGSKTQGGRLLAVLADGRAHTTAEIHRKAGNMIVHSRVSELRRAGFTIVCEHVPGRSGSRGYRYTWTDAPGKGDAEVFEPHSLPWETVSPRDADNRFRIYRLRADALLELLATTPDAEGVGVTLCALGPERAFEGCRIGVLDTHGTDDTPGTWIVKPWDQD